MMSCFVKRIHGAVGKLVMADLLTADGKTITVPATTAILDAWQAGRPVDG